MIPVVDEELSSQTGTLKYGILRNQIAPCLKCVDSFLAEENFTQALTDAEQTVLSRVLSTENYEYAYSAARFLHENISHFIELETIKPRGFSTLSYIHQELVISNRYVDSSRVAAVMIILSTRDPVSYSVIYWENAFAFDLYNSIRSEMAQGFDNSNDARLLLNYLERILNKYSKFQTKPDIVRTAENIKRGLSKIFLAENFNG